MSLTVKQLKEFIQDYNDNDKVWIFDETNHKDPWHEDIYVMQEPLTKSIVICIDEEQS